MTQEIDTNLFDQKVEVPEAIVGGKLAVEVVRQELIPVIRAARDMVVVDELSYQQAMALASECGRRSKKVEAEFAEAKEKTHAAWKAVTTLIASFTKPLDEARSMLNKKGTRWYDAEMARRKAEAERVRKEKEKADEDERLQLAEELAKNGNTKLADAVLEETTYVAPEPVEVPAAAGSTRVAKWTFEVTDIMALLRAIVDGKEQASLVQLNTVLLGQMARQQKEAAKVTGIRFFDEGTMRHA
jgi:hypothetical protein